MYTPENGNWQGISIRGEISALVWKIDFPVISTTERLKSLSLGESGNSSNKCSFSLKVHANENSFGFRLLTETTGE